MEMVPTKIGIQTCVWQFFPLVSLGMYRQTCLWHTTFFWTKAAPECTRYGVWELQTLLRDLHPRFHQRTVSIYYMEDENVACRSSFSITVSRAMLCYHHYHHCYQQLSMYVASRASPSSPVFQHWQVKRIRSTHVLNTSHTLNNQ